MKSPAVLLSLLLASGLSLLRADLPVEVRSTGSGAVVLARDLPRASLDKLLAEAPAAAGVAAPALWLRWADGTDTALDMEVTRLLPDGLLKVYTMSSTSPVLAPGERSGPAQVVVRQTPPFAPDDWTLKPGETAEKAALVLAFHERYGTGKCAGDLTYYLQPEVIGDGQASDTRKQGAREAAEARPAPALRSPGPRGAKLALPVSVIAPGRAREAAVLAVSREALTRLPDPVQVPLGNYNYDLATIESLDKPNELTVATAQGLDLFALAQTRWGRAVAAVELVCYNRFTSTLTAPGQGLLLCPPDGDFAAALGAGEVIYASFEKPVIVALRQPGQSPAESASGVLAIQVLLR
jgi:hypothetical protein